MASWPIKNAAELSALKFACFEKKIAVQIEITLHHDIHAPSQKRETNIPEQLVTQKVVELLL